MASQKFPNDPFLYDTSGNMIGYKNPDDTDVIFVTDLESTMTPVDGVRGTLVSDMTNGNADITLTSVAYSSGANDITIVYVNPAGNNKDLSVTVTGNAISVSLATGAGGAITSTATLVVAALTASTAAAALVTATAEGTGAGVVNAKSVAALSGGVTCSPGAVGCHRCNAAGTLVYRKMTAQTWKSWPVITGGVAVTSTSAELNLLDDLPKDFTFTPAAGAANVCEVTIQARDAAGVAMTRAVMFLLYLSDASTGVGLTGTAASGAVDVKTSGGANFGAITAKKALIAQTKTDGTFILSITDTSKTLYYVCAVPFRGGAPSVSARLITGNYGA